MSDILGLLLGLAVIGALVALAAKPVNRWAWKAERALTLCSSGLIMFSMLFVSAEVISRKLFNAPIPGHLELAELFLPPIIFLAVAYTQSTGGHVRMTIFIDKLGPGARYGVEITAKVFSVLIYALLCYYSAVFAHRAWSVGDVTMSPPYFVTWPSSALVSVGIFFGTLRLYLELLHLVAPKWLPAGEPGLDNAGRDSVRG